MRTTERIATSMVAAALALTMTVPAFAGDQTRVTSISASASGSSISVSGTAVFVDDLATVVEDPVGDALPPGFGADIATGTIGRAPGSDALSFTLHIADMSPVGSYGIVYGWGLNVDGSDTGLFLAASTVGTCGAEGCFSLHRQITPNQAVPVTPLSGVIGDGMVRWHVPLSSIGASDGSVIDAGSGGPNGSITGIHGVGWGGLISDRFTPGEYRVPAASVELGIAPVGTLESSVPLFVQATVNPSTGTFSGALPKPAEAGEYVLVARACYVPNICGSASTTIVIA